MGNLNLVLALVLVLVLVLALALVLALVLALSATSALAEGKLVVYTPNPDAEIQNILNPFIEKYGVEVELMSMGTGNCYTKLLAEMENPTVDVMFGGVEATWTHDYPDLFMTYVANGNDVLPEAYKNPDGMIAAVEKLIEILTA